MKSMSKSTKAILGIMAALVLWALAGNSAWAVDPNPDNKTLVFPALVPKSGASNIPPSDSASGLIRNAYETFFERRLGTFNRMMNFPFLRHAEGDYRLMCSTVSRRVR